MTRYFRAVQITSRPQSSPGGMTYLEMSSKLKRMRVEEDERGSSGTLRELARRLLCELTDGLDLRE
jgi:hypothetical protein